MKETDFLADLNVGGQVLVSSNNATYVRRIARLTATQIITKHGANETRYHKRDGREVGSSGRWDGSWLAQATPEKLTRIALKNAQARLLRSLHDVTRQGTEQLTQEQIDEIHTLLRAHGLFRKDAP